MDNFNSPSIQHHYNEMLAQTVLRFQEMVKHEVRLGLFRDDRPIKIMNFMLYKVGVNIQAYLIFMEVVNPVKGIEKNRPVYEGEKNRPWLYTLFVKPSLDKKIE